MQNHYLTIIIFLISLNRVQNVNILYINSVASPSHNIWNRALALGLVNKGYNVTYLSPDEDTSTNPNNFNFIYLEDVYEGLHDTFDLNEMADWSALGMLAGFRDWSIFQCERIVKTKGLHNLWNYPKDFKFDAIIMDLTAGVCLNQLIPRFGYPPSVGVTPFLLPPYLSHNFGNHLFPSYIPWFGLPYSNSMTFVQRMWNHLYTFLDIYQRDNFEYPTYDRLMRQVFGNDLISWAEVQRHISLLLANTDPILDFPQVFPPNIIPVGGLHTRKSKNLPKDLQDILDSAENGVVLMSLGTNVRSDKLSPDIQRALVSAFSKIPQTVVWKFESTLSDLPKNVIIKKWLPQNDILGHPNVKLFIGHGGALSTQEAMYHGVPMILMPFFVDQHTNTRLVINKKIGLKVDIKLITEKSFSKTLDEILNDKMYSRNVKLISKRFRDRTETPLERAIFWIEYSMRHQGASFLNTPAREVPAHVSSNADVTAFLILMTIITLYVLYKVVVGVLRLISSHKHKRKLH